MWNCWGQERKEHGGLDETRALSLFGSTFYLPRQLIRPVQSILVRTR